MSNLKCPLLNKPCIEHQCAFYTHVIGTDPQTEAHIDKFDCAIAWMPKLLIENTKTSIENNAEVNEIRKELSENRQQISNGLHLVAIQLQKANDTAQQELALSQPQTLEPDTSGD